MENRYPHTFTLTLKKTKEKNKLSILMCYSVQTNTTVVTRLYSVNFYWKMEKHEGVNMWDIWPALLGRNTVEFACSSPLVGADWQHSDLHHIPDFR
jgi:hypothetical protein